METPAGGTAALENRLGRLHVLCRWFPRAGRASARCGGEDHDNRMDVRRSEAQCGRSKILHPAGHFQECAFARGAQGTSPASCRVKGDYLNFVIKIPLFLCTPTPQLRFWSLSLSYWRGLSAGCCI